MSIKKMKRILKHKRTQTLVIFDMDQTLVELFNLHNKTTSLTFKKVFNVNAKLDEIKFAGKTIKDNLTRLALLKGISKKEIEKNISRLIKVYSKTFITLLKKRKVNGLRGARQLIKRLSKDKNNILILLTGDSKDITTAVLKKIKLFAYFRFIITGEKEKSRTDLIRKAVRSIKRKYNIKKIVVIGDSTNDVKAGKAVHATVITVLTGFNLRKELKNVGADYVFKDLTDKRIYDIITKKIKNRGDK